MKIPMLQYIGYDITRIKMFTRYMKWKRMIEPLFIIILIISASIINFWHVLSAYMQRPADHVFIGISHYYQDYFYYLSQVSQGLHGQWLVTNSFTTESIPATPLWMVNLLIGKIAAVLHILPWTAYDISVYISSLVSLVFLYFVTRKLFPSDAVLRIGSFALSVFTTCYYRILPGPNGTYTIKPYEYFYSYTLSLNRLGGVTHLILQNILSLLVIVLYAEIIQQIIIRKTTLASNIKLIAAEAVCINMLMWINPQYVAVDAVTICIVSVIYLIAAKGYKHLPSLLIVGFVIGIPLLFPLLIFMQTFSLPFYQYFRWWESSIRTIDFRTFFLSMGPILACMAAGIIPYVRKLSPLRSIGLVYIVVPVILYFSPVPRLLTLPYFRLMQPPAYVFIAALAIEGLRTVGVIASKIFRRKMINPVVTFLVILFLLFQVPMIGREIEMRTNGLMMNSWLNYPDKPLIDGLVLLSRQPNTGNVLAFNLTELLIPAVTGFTLYEAHESLTINYGGKIGETAKFFSCAMIPSRAVEFLKSNRIRYIVWKNIDGNPTRYIDCYPFLKVLIQNSSITVFTP